MFPLYEGWDEPAHLAYVQHIAERKDLPTINDHISNEIQYSMGVYPQTEYMRYFGKNYTDFWNDFNYPRGWPCKIFGMALRSIFLSSLKADGFHSIR